MQNTNPTETKRILVIQLGPLSSMIQSLMALRAAKQLYPQIEVHVLAESSTQDLLDAIPWLSRYYILDIQRLAKEDKPIAFLQEWATPLLEEPWDFLFNWSFSSPASFLASWFPAKTKLGPVRRLREWTLQYLDGWSQYVAGTVDAGFPQNIHRTDIITTQLLTALQIQLGEPKGENLVGVQSKSFFDLPPVPREWEITLSDYSRRWIAMHVGESAWDAKQWGMLLESFYKTEPNVGIFILYTPKETELVDALKEDFLSIQTKDPKFLHFVDVSGPFALWSILTGRCQWLISASIPAIHLASVLGTRMIQLATEDQIFYDQGAYGNGHYVVTQGKHLPDPHAIYHLWAHAIQEWTSRPVESLLSNLQEVEKTDGLRIYRSRIRSGTDGGGVVYELLTPLELTFGDWSALVTGQLARNWYCGWLPPVGSELRRGQMTPELIRDLRHLLQHTRVYRRVVEQCIDASQDLRQKLERVRSQAVMPIEVQQCIRAKSYELQQLDDVMQQLSIRTPFLGIFTNMRKIMLNDIRSESPSEVIQQGLDCYTQLQDGLVLVESWIQASFEIVKPVALKPRDHSHVELS